MDAGTTTELPVVVIGAGPVGLAAAAHLLERGLEPLVLEAGDGPGAAVASWGHVRLFSPWRYDVDAAARRLLEATGTWSAPDPDHLPTGAELVRDYLAPLAATPALRDRVRYGTRVTAVARDGADRTRSLGRERRPYLVRTTGSDGAVRDVRARAVLDCSGTYGQRNPVGASGLPAVGEAESAAFLAGPLPDVLGADRARFAGRHALVVGMGHSAANSLLSLVRLAEQVPGIRITWAIRGGSARRLYGGGQADDLPARGELGTRLRAAVEAGRLELVTRVAIDRLEPHAGQVRVLGTGRRDGVDGVLDLTVDTIVDATGFRPDLDMLREVRLELDPVVEAPARLAPLIDPNLHSCGTVPPHGESVLSHPDEGFYLVGMKSYGRAPTFLLATGYEQARSVAAALAGDREGADLVQLELPATGVCSSDLALEAEDVATSGGCCGTAPAGPQPVELGFATGVAHGRSGDLVG
ncbi:FAD-dependent oxidoreductase [Isoptericola variabilis]|uniref:FAD dependent oxidoreductase n=1 Tax=Isoptericola variabilis (strain 225) TaxID=743718 RepID=F6FRS1_ISOV2|nr:FAD-dependent oxidoreductase [Isoptericola variabilis]AEG43012.1 FAD dependent oxidoreductase [Isoptericola variabilis 225]TWH30119.1 cation diffusion facilitator CzcD-associated flavoprotein CzcO [Isoptericola variabilis J7]